MATGEAGTEAPHLHRAAAAQERRSEPRVSTATPAEACTVWLLAPDPTPDPTAEARVWGLDACERVRRILACAGVEAVVTLAPAATAPLPPQTNALVLLRGDHFFDERLIQALIESGGPERILAAARDRDGRANWVAARVQPDRADEALGVLRASEAGGGALRPADLAPAVPTDLVPAYHPALRKSDPPFLYPATPDSVREAENHIFASSYKGLTDLVTKWVWPLPAREFTRVLARHGIRPNTVTALSYVLTFLAIGLFAGGWFASGLLAAWAMTFLDTVDGKLARCTLTSSRLGHVLDHGLDLVHPPLWWIAFAYGLAPGMAGYEWPMAIIVGGYLVGRALEGIFMVAFGMEIFLWRPFDGFFRQIIARRNPNLILLTAGVAAGRPDVGYLAVAAWTLLSNGVHAVRLLQAFAARRDGISIRPWFEDRDPA